MAIKISSAAAVRGVAKRVVAIAQAVRNLTLVLALVFWPTWGVVARIRGMRQREYREKFDQQIASSPTLTAIDDGTLGERLAVVESELPITDAWLSRRLVALGFYLLVLAICLGSREPVVVGYAIVGVFLSVYVTAFLNIPKVTRTWELPGTFLRAILTIEATKRLVSEVEYVQRSIRGLESISVALRRRARRFTVTANQAVAVDLENIAERKAARIRTLERLLLTGDSVDRKGILSELAGDLLLVTEGDWQNLPEEQTLPISATRVPIKVRVTWSVVLVFAVGGLVTLSFFNVALGGLVTVVVTVLGPLAAFAARRLGVSDAFEQGSKWGREAVAEDGKDKT